MCGPMFICQHWSTGAGTHLAGSLSLQTLVTWHRNRVLKEPKGQRASTRGYSTFKAALSNTNTTANVKNDSTKYHYWVTKNYPSEMVGMMSIS